MAEIIKIVLTGGPCGGKSTAKKYIEKFFAEHDFNVLFVPESATVVLNEGKYVRGSEEFRNAVYSLQLKNEIEAEKNATDKTLIVCDRGTMDSAAYTDSETFDFFLKTKGSDIVKEKDRYDAVFHLETAAVCAEGYTVDNNPARNESAAEAALLDKKTLSVWTGHNHLRFIGSGESFEEKMKKLVEEIAFFVGIPEKVEIERKFLIKKPDVVMLRTLPCCCEIDIEQAYLKTKEGVNRRIRKRGEKGFFSFFITEKKKISDIKRVEIEKRISREEYYELLKETDESCATVAKKRFTLMYEGTYFEIDIFPFSEEKAFLEIELKREDEGFNIPDFLQVIKEVTTDGEYTNFSLAKKLKNCTGDVFETV